MKRTLLTAVLCAALLITSLTGCSATNQGNLQASQSSSSGVSLSPVTASGSYSDRDKEAGYDPATSVLVTLKGDSAEFTGGGVSFGDGRLVISKAGTYILTGELADGQIIVRAGDTDKVQIVLDNLQVSCSYGSAIHMQNGDKVFLTLAEGSNNQVSDGKVYSLADGEDDSNAAIFSKVDLTLNGTGTLVVAGNYNHGIHSKDDLIITGGNYEIVSTNDGLKGKDCVQILDGSFTIVAGGDGISSSNNTDTLRGYVQIDGGNFSIQSGGDGIQAETALTVTGGDFSIITGGGWENAPLRTPEQMGGQRTQGGSGTWGEKPNRTTGTAGVVPTSVTASSTLEQTTETTAATTVSQKGIKAVTNLTVTGGTFVLNTLEDSLHCDGNLLVQGGNFTLASGDDGIHADSALIIQEGTVKITQSYEGIEGETVEVTGGDLWIVASDDGINAADALQTSSPGRPSSNANIQLAGGRIYIEAKGDGIDSNSMLTVSGGQIAVCCPVNTGNSALDFDGTGTITGGTLVAFGGAKMAQSFSQTENQGQIMVAFSTEMEAGTPLTLTDSTGAILLTAASSDSFQNVVISSPQIQQGESYTLYQGGEHSGTLEMGYYSEGNHTLGEKVMELTMDQLTVRLNQDGTAYSGEMGGGMGGGRPNGNTPPQGAGTPPQGEMPPQMPPSVQNSTATE